jgi:hypothetical protein
MHWKNGTHHSDHDFFSDIFEQCPRVKEVQGDQKSLYTWWLQYKKHAKIFPTVSITYHENVVRIRDNRWRQCESSVPQALAVGCQAVKLSQLMRLERRVLWSLLVTFCSVIIGCTETFDRPVYLRYPKTSYPEWGFLQHALVFGLSPQYSCVLRSSGMLIRRVLAVCYQLRSWTTTKGEGSFFPNSFFNHRASIRPCTSCAADSS